MKKNKYRQNLLDAHQLPGWDPTHGCHTIPKLVKLFNVKKMAEVGVCVGHTATEVLDQNKLDKYYLIDHWRDKSKLDLIRRNFKEPCVKIICMDSIEALNEIWDKTLDMVYLDTIHTYEQTKKEIYGWYAKVKEGGIIAGDGYGYKVNGVDGCRQAVHDFFAPRRIHKNMGPDYIWWVIKNDV